MEIKQWENGCLWTCSSGRVGVYGPVAVGERVFMDL